MRLEKRAALALLRRLRQGRIEVREGGGREVFGAPGSPLRTTLTVHDPRFWRSLRRGSTGLALSYAEGLWDCDDIASLARIGGLELPRLDRARLLLQPFQRAARLIPRNTRGLARSHIAAHYDLGNELFSLFLDETMTYSCAYFERPGMTLAEAQAAKLDLACRKLELTPNDHLLEIGTGWGSLAVHAASRYGCRVTTTTISREQHAGAVARIRAAGLEDRVRVVMTDYRDLRGRFNKLVSIEMIEAVGWQYFDIFFRRCSQLLTPQGLMLLQAIVIDDDAYETEKASPSFINRLIFPGGCLPSLRVIGRCLARSTSLRTLGVEDLTAHYPETLRRWRERFLANAGRLAELGYDRRFRRLWELYLSWCEGGFLSRRIGDAQLLLAGSAYRPAAPTAGQRTTTPQVAAGSV
jgi:cyclopropane-fatty-acyl-phospholipid synthase